MDKLNTAWKWFYQTFYFNGMMDKIAGAYQIKSAGFRPTWVNDKGEELKPPFPWRSAIVLGIVALGILWLVKKTVQTIKQKIK